MLCRHSASAESLSWLALSASLVQTSWRPLLTGVLVGSCRCASWHAFVPCWSCLVCLHPHLLLYRCAVVLVAASRWPPCLAAELRFCIKSAHEVPCALISQSASHQPHTQDRDTLSCVYTASKPRCGFFTAPGAAAGLLQAHFPALLGMYLSCAYGSGAPRCAFSRGVACVQNMTGLAAPLGMELVTC